MSLKELSMELPTNSFAALKNIISDIKTNLTEMLVPLKEIRDILSNKFSSEPLNSIQGVMTILAGLATAIAGLFIIVAVFAVIIFF